MTEALVPYVTRNLDDTMTLGNVLAKSGYFADSREAAQAVVKVLAGAELGFGPIASMTGVNIIKGKVTLSANLIAAAIKRSGRYNYRVRTLTDDACSIEFYEGGQLVGVSGFTMADAKAAGLATGDNWRKFPRNMLFARAISNGAKWYCPDLSGGPIYTPDELGATIDGETGDVIDAPARPVVTPPTNGAQAQANDASDREFGELPAHDASAYQPETTNAIELPFKDQGTAVKWAAQFPHYQKDGKPDYAHAVGGLKKVCTELGCSDRDVNCWGATWMQHVLSHTHPTHADLDELAASQS